MNSGVERVTSSVANDRTDVLTAVQSLTARVNFTQTC